MLSNFKWYRKLRGGRWIKATASIRFVQDAQTIPLKKFWVQIPQNGENYVGRLEVNREENL